MRISLVFLLSFFVFFISCKKSTEPTGEEDLENKIYVKVSDKNGNPIESVGLHFYAELLSFGANANSKSISKGSKLTSIELMDFYYVKYPDNVIKLIWKTSSEIENSGFMLFRSEDSSSSALIASYQTDSLLQGQGTTNNVSEYYYSDSSVDLYKEYTYDLYSVTIAGVSEKEGTIIFSSYSAMVPRSYELSQNYPNPFNPTTIIRFALPKSGYVNLQIQSLIDSTVKRTLMNRELSLGWYSMQWDGKSDDGQYLTNNIYRYVLKTDDFEDEKELCLSMADPGHIKSLNCLPLTKTNAAGELVIDYDIFPINKNVPWIDDTGCELGNLDVPDSLSLFFIKEGYQSEIKKVLIDSLYPLELNIEMSLE